MNDEVDDDDEEDDDDDEGSGLRKKELDENSSTSRTPSKNGNSMQATISPVKRLNHQQTMSIPSRQTTIHVKSQREEESIAPPSLVPTPKNPIS